MQQTEEQTTYNDLFKKIAQKTGSGFLPSYSVSVNQPYPQVWQWQMMATYETGKMGRAQKTITAYFPFLAAFRFMLCSGDDCDLFDDPTDDYGDHVKTGDPQFDAQFRLRSKDPDKIKEIVLHPDLRPRLLALKNIRMAMDHDDSKQPFTLTVSDLGDVIDPDAMADWIDVARVTLNVALEVVVAAKPSETTV